MSVVLCVLLLSQLCDPLEHLLVAGIWLPLTIPETFFHSDLVLHLRISCANFLSSRNPTLLHIFQDFGLKKIPEKKTSEADTFNMLKVGWVTL